MDLHAFPTEAHLRAAVSTFEQGLMEAFRTTWNELERLRSAVRARQEWENTALNLQQAARESGYSADHLGRLVRSGEIANAGRENAPKVLRKHLPRRPGVDLTPPPLRLQALDARSAPQTGGNER